MANASLTYVHLSSKEVAAFSNIISLSFAAFEIAEYPYYFDYFLTAIVQVITLGAMAANQIFPHENYWEFSTEFDCLSGFIRDVHLLDYKKRRQ